MQESLKFCECVVENQPFSKQSKVFPPRKEDFCKHCGKRKQEGQDGPGSLTRIFQRTIADFCLKIMELLKQTHYFTKQF